MTGHQRDGLHGSERDPLTAPASCPCRRDDTKASADRAALALNSGRTIGKRPGAVNARDRVVHAGFRARIAAVAGLFAIVAGLVAAALTTSASAVAQGRTDPPPVWVPVPTRVDPDREARQRIDSAQKPVDDRDYVRVDAPTRMLDAISFVAEGRAYRLAGVRPADRARICRTETGARWACGLRATTALSGWIAGRLLACRVLGPVPPADPVAGSSQPHRPTPVPARCELDRTSLAVRLVAEGWAEPLAADDPELAPALAAARRDRRGLWADHAPSP